jgi:hypothetical protein
VSSYLSLYFFSSRIFICFFFCNLQFSDKSQSLISLTIDISTMNLRQMTQILESLLVHFYYPLNSENKNKIAGQQSGSSGRVLATRHKALSSDPSTPSYSTHACDPSYSGGRDQEDRSSKPSQANSLGEPISKNPSQKMGWWSDSRCGPLSSRPSTAHTHTQIVSITLSRLLVCSVFLSPFSYQRKNYK